MQDIFTSRARRSLEALYCRVFDDARERIVDTLDVLVHDGYLERCGGGYRFPSRLLKDWWWARFHDHHVALDNRNGGDGAGARGA